MKPSINAWPELKREKRIARETGDVNLERSDYKQKYTQSQVFFDDAKDLFQNNQKKPYLILYWST